MFNSNELIIEPLNGIEETDKYQEFRAYLGRITTLAQRGEQSVPEINLSGLAEIITPQSPIVIFSMEYYGGNDIGIKGSGGLGILVADIRRVSEQLSIPLTVITPFYSIERHQQLELPSKFAIKDIPPPNNFLFEQLGKTTINSQSGQPIVIDAYAKKFGSTQILTVTNRSFGELYPGNSSGDYRLYQEVVLGFAGFDALNKAGLKPSFMQLNEAPTVFAAVAWLDYLCTQGLNYDSALAEVSNHTLYTNHTLVQAVESQFNIDQFNELVMPNIRSQEVRSRIANMFSDNILKLSSLAFELARIRSGVSKLHSKISSTNFLDARRNNVTFEAVTNGISSEWTLPDIMTYLHDVDILDEFDLPTIDYVNNLDRLDPVILRGLKLLGRKEMNRILYHRKDQNGESIQIPEDILLFNFKRRFASYKRPEMLFQNPDKLAQILKTYNAHLIMAGKPHPDDFGMQIDLDNILNLVDSHKFNGETVLRERVHYIQDYDEELGRALTFGSDCAINIPVVGQEACGTSWMKDLRNFQLLISTPDGGVADGETITYLLVSGEDEVNTMYDKMIEAAEIYDNNAKYKRAIIDQLKTYLPVISGSRMMASYLSLYQRISI